MKNLWCMAHNKKKKKKHTQHKEGTRHELIMFRVWKCVLGFCGHKESRDANGTGQRLLASAEIVL